MMIVAQGPLASVVGRVTDPSGAAVVGVAIRITNAATNLQESGVSNHAGDYTLPFLAPGTYSLEAAREGFIAYKRLAFTLDVDQEQRVDIRLTVGSALQTITVADTPETLQRKAARAGK